MTSPWIASLKDSSSAASSSSRTNRERPFFLMLALTAAYVLLDPHPDHAGHSKAAEYGDVVEEVDDNIGKLLARLKAARHRQRHRSSSSPPTTAHGSKAPRAAFASARAAQPGTASYRVPFIARQPGRIPAGLVSSDAMTMNIDLLPTLTSWTGSPLPAAELDGPRHLNRPHQQRSVAPRRTHPLQQRNRRRHPHRPLETRRAQLLPRHRSPLDTRDDWQLLIDLKSDPAETYDVSTLHPDALADMTARLANARARFEPWPCTSRNDGDSYDNHCDYDRHDLCDFPAIAVLAAVPLVVTAAVPAVQVPATPHRGSSSGKRSASRGSRLAAPEGVAETAPPAEAHRDPRAQGRG